MFLLLDEWAFFSSLLFLFFFSSESNPCFTQVEHLQQGPCIAIEVRGEGVVQKLRELCGPSDPEIARHLRAKSLRALYGQNQVKNAVHCTDLAEDGPLESEFFFSILQKSEHLKH